jgi:hypothetical protein
MQVESHPPPPLPAAELVEPRIEGRRQRPRFARLDHPAAAVLGWLLGMLTSLVFRPRTRRRRSA